MTKKSNKLATYVTQQGHRNIQTFTKTGKGPLSFQTITCNMLFQQLLSIVAVTLFPIPKQPTDPPHPTAQIRTHQPSEILLAL